ncbi:MAG: phosphatidylglycerol lysyltransferase domain-containing protein [Clostridiales Family XIII bacterium]|jgi:hypothetical protein|nr:phosphatidylglycerol lysyltransferase domain-containing protein [Clostridiales Family XIII bacterium]
MYIFDGRVTLEDRELLESYLTGFDYKTSGMTYTSMYMWRDINLFSWEEIGGYLFISAADNLDPVMGDPFMFPPLTRTGGYEPGALREAVLEAKRRFEGKGKPFHMMLVPFHMLDILGEAFPGGIAFEADRPNFDYVYNAQDLAELRGRDFHAKKNHLNYFKGHYEYTYERMTPDMAGEAMAFIRAFNERKNLEDPHERELLEFEEQAMRDVFVNLDVVGYLSGCIRIGGKIEALTVGGLQGPKTAVVHVEKANTEYRGLYQAIANEFVKAVMAGHRNVSRINREEDMGLPGLRKAKLSLHPVKLVEKYTVTLK